MKQHSEGLREATVKYLLMLAELDCGNGVRCAAVARALGVTRPSVHAMIEEMRQTGLVEKERYGRIYLTPAGRKIAAQYGDSCRHLTQLLTYWTGLQDGTCRCAACLILARTPQQELAGLQNRLQAMAMPQIS